MHNYLFTIFILLSTISLAQISELKIDSILNNGYQHRIKGRNYAAEEQYTIALRIAKNHYGDSAKITAKCYVFISELESIRGNYDAVKALAMNKKMMDEFSKTNPELKEQYDELYRVQLATYKQNITYFNKIRNNTPLSIESSNELTASSLMNQGRNTEALGFIKQSIIDKSEIAWTYQLALQLEPESQKDIFKTAYQTLSKTPYQSFLLRVYEIKNYSFTNETLLTKLVQTINTHQQILGAEVTEIEKVHMNNQLKWIFDKAIQTASELNKNKEAFIIAEFSKNKVLQQLVNQQHFYRVADVPDDIISKYNTFHNKIRILKQQNLTASNRDFAINTQQIETNKIALINLLSILKSKHPKFHKLIQGDSLNLNQKIISQHPMLSYYLSSDSTLHRWNILPDTVFHYASKERELFSISKRFLSSIKKLKKEKFNIYSHQLFNILFKDDKIVDNLIIIPHQYLYNIPFEALLSNKWNKVNYSTAPFLLQKTNITYAQTYFLNNSSNLKTNKYLTISPFENTDLPFSEKEVQCVHNTYANTIQLKNEKATTDNLLAIQDNYHTIHFATHSIYNRKNSHLNAIKLYNGSLTVEQLYGLKIKANTIILSSCKSGVGEINKVEGILSLHRPFFYHGTKTVIYSQWNINDQSTYELFKSYYHLNSLALAKRAIIKNSIYSFPYYWAGLVHYTSI